MENLKHVILRKFNESELIFDEQETSEILRFFFKNDHSLINSITINDKLRGFSQGLLIEAVNASYAIGYVKIIFDVFYKQPSKPLKKVLKQLGKKASKHWFNENVKATALHDLKIYEMVRSKIELNFRRHFITLAAGLAVKEPAVAVYAYSTNKSQ